MKKKNTGRTKEEINKRDHYQGASYYAPQSRSLEMMNKKMRKIISTLKNKKIQKIKITSKIIF